MHFFTMNEEETRLRLLPRGATTLEAAESAHMDMAKGFIRADADGTSSPKQGRSPNSVPAGSFGWKRKSTSFRTGTRCCFGLAFKAAVGGKDDQPSFASSAYWL